MITILAQEAVQASQTAPLWAVPAGAVIGAVGGSLLTMVSTYFSDKRKAQLDKDAKINDKIRDEAADLMRAVTDIQQTYWKNRNAWRAGQRDELLKETLLANDAAIREKRVVAHHCVARIGLVAPAVLHLEALQLASIAMMNGVDEFGIDDEDRWQEFAQHFTEQYARFTAYVRHETGIDPELQLGTGKRIDLAEYRNAEYVR